MNRSSLHVAFEGTAAHTHTHTDTHTYTHTHTHTCRCTQTENREMRRKEIRERKRSRRRYLLPSSRVPGKGLPLNMDADHPKSQGGCTFERERVKDTHKERQERDRHKTGEAWLQSKHREHGGFTKSGKGEIQKQQYGGGVLTPWYIQTYHGRWL